MTIFPHRPICLAKWRCSDNFVYVAQVVLTPTHLAIVMEYAAGGELFERIVSAGRFSEDEVFLLFLAKWEFLVSEFRFSMQVEW